VIFCLQPPLSYLNTGQFLNREDRFDRLDDGFELVLVSRNPMVVVCINVAICTSNRGGCMVALATVDT
jgi:hypothetical protein